MSGAAGSGGGAAAKAAVLVRLSVRGQDKLDARAIAAFYGETWADVECTNCALEVAPVKMEVSVGSPSMFVGSTFSAPPAECAPGGLRPQGFPAAIRRQRRDCWPSGQCR